MLSDCKSDSTLPLWLLSNDMYQQDNVLSDMYVLLSAAKNLPDLNIRIFSLAAFLKKLCANVNNNICTQFNFYIFIGFTL